MPGSSTVVGARDLRLTDKYADVDGRHFLTGVQALVRLLIDQTRSDQRDGLSSAALVSGYEGSPLGGFDIELKRQAALVAAHGIIHQPGVNEELAATALLGSQLVNTTGAPRFDRVVGLWYGKAPGLDRATDAIRHANHIGCPPTGGVLAVVGDDPGAKSSTLPSASEAALSALGVPTLYPGDPEEVIRLGLYGYALSRASGLWVGLKMATSVADGSQTVDVADTSVVPVLPEVEVDGSPFTHVPSAALAGAVTLGLEQSLFETRLEVARRFSYANGLNRIVGGGQGDQLGIVAAGRSFFDLRQALDQLGLDEAQLRRLGIRLFHVGMVYPLEGRAVREFARGLSEIVVIEEKRSFLEAQIRDILYPVADRPVVVGKTDEDGAALVPMSGELGADDMARVVARRVLRRSDVDSVRHWSDADRLRPVTGLPLVVRTPYFCSGCPHNRSVRVPEGALVGAGIGCHGMAVLMKPEEVGVLTGLTQMGGEGAQWIGMSPFTTVEHLFQNLGDGTFFHSGSLALRAAVASGVNITYKLLVNSAVAMTGGQAVMGAAKVPELTRLLLAEGVQRVIVTTEDLDRYRHVSLAPGVEVWDRSRLLEAQTTLSAIAGVTVLIHDQECAAEKRRKRKRGQLGDPPTRIFINERICEGCGDCGVKSNCLSVQPVETEFGQKTKIHQASCNKDYSCLDGDCPSFLSVEPGPPPPASPKPTASASPGVVELADLPAPDEAPVVAGTFSIRLLGVGGTGIVTTSHLLGTAALLDGLAVRGLDQTGLAQKGGPVISDLKISAEQITHGNKISVDECDLYLGCDLVVAADPRNLSVCRDSRTRAVVSDAIIPTGDMIGKTGITFPEADRLRAIVGDRTAALALVHLDAHDICRRLFGGEAYVNVFLVGMAYQAGFLPVTAESIEAVIDLNGVAVGANIQAFRRGRQAIANRAALERALAQVPGTPEVSASIEVTPASVTSSPVPSSPVPSSPVTINHGAEVKRLVALRVAELTAYQDAAYAQRYADLVAMVAATEARVVPGRHQLAGAVARYLYKLMAYKDEYEVARLATDPTVAARLAEEFGPGAVATMLLHPPLLRALGLDHKIRLGPRTRPVFVGLREMRRLRGSAFDPFGYTKVRRAERALVVEYESIVQQICANLTPANHRAAVDLASLPDMVRGYEEIKLRSVDRYHERLRELMAAFDTGL